jgi:hypothetical protein
VSVPAYIGIGVAHVLLGLYFSHTRPESPDPQAGAVHRYKGISDVVYLTDTEHALLVLSFWTMLAFAVVALAVGFLDPKRRH